MDRKDEEMERDVTEPLFSKVRTLWIKTVFFGSQLPMTLLRKKQLASMVENALAKYYKGALNL